MKAFFFNIPAHGHVNPTIPVVTELVRRGEHITYVNTEAFRSRIDSTGVTFLPYPFVPAMARAMQNAGGGNIPRNALALTQVSDQILPWVLELLKHENPDYVIFDSLSAWAKYAAKILNIPTVTSVTTLIVDTKKLPPMSLREMVVILAQTFKRVPEYARTARHMRKAFGIRLHNMFDSVMSLGDYNIVYTSELFQPNSAALGPGFKLVGPALSLQPGSGTPPWPFDQPIRRPLVYISLGTLNNNNPEFYRACFNAFANHPGQFVLSVGKGTDIAGLGQVPPENFIVRNSVPQLDVLQHVDLFITHGGMNSVHEALYFGVPLILAPQQLEQATVAKRVEQLGAGMTLAAGAPSAHDRVSVSELQIAVARMLNAAEPYQRAAQRIGESFRNAGGAVRAADEIMAFTRQRRSSTS